MGVRCIGLDFRSPRSEGRGGHTQRQSFRAFSTFRLGNFLVGKNEGRERKSPFKSQFGVGLKYLV